MPLYTFKCQSCGLTKEVIAKMGTDYIDCSECETVVKNGDKEIGRAPSLMTLVLGTPSAPQWNCRTAHSRSKGF